MEGGRDPEKPRDRVSGEKREAAERGAEVREQRCLKEIVMEFCGVN